MTPRPAGAIRWTAVLARTSSLLLLLFLVVGGPARAQPAIEVQVPLGKTTKVELPYVQGLNCDDPTVVEAKLSTSKDKRHLYLVLQGRSAGDTYCRAGTGLGPTVLVHVTVIEPET